MSSQHLFTKHCRTQTTNSNFFLYIFQNVLLFNEYLDGRSCHPSLKDGGALQISCHGFQVDYYPYHLAMGDRKHWTRYREGSVPHTQWLDQSLNSFRSKFIDLVDKNRSQHVPLSRSPQQPHTTSPVNKTPDSQNNVPGGTSPELAKKPVNTVKNYVMKQLPKLMTTCIIIRIEDFTLYRVTTSGKKQALKEFICGKLRPIFFD